VQEALLVASRFGMNVTIARPEGYDLDPQVYEWTQQNCAEQGTSFQITDDPDAAYDGVHVVYSRNWVTSAAYQDGAFQKKAEQDKAKADPRLDHHRRAHGPHRQRHLYPPHAHRPWHGGQRRGRQRPAQRHL
jgi:hypothetical protein